MLEIWCCVFYKGELGMFVPEIGMEAFGAAFNSEALAAVLVEGQYL